MGGCALTENVINCLSDPHFLHISTVASVKQYLYYCSKMNKVEMIASVPRIFGFSMMAKVLEHYKCCQWVSSSLSPACLSVSHGSRALPGLRTHRVWVWFVLSSTFQHWASCLFSWHHVMLFFIYIYTYIHRHLCICAATAVASSAFPLCICVNHISAELYLIQFPYYEVFL